MSQQEIDSLALRRIAAGVEPGQAWSSYQAAARALDRIPAGAVPDRLRARVALLGSFTLEPFVPVLRVEAARAGIWLDSGPRSRSSRSTRTFCGTSGGRSRRRSRPSR